MFKDSTGSALFILYIFNCVLTLHFSICLQFMFFFQTVQNAAYLV